MLIVLNVYFFLMVLMTVFVIYFGTYSDNTKCMYLKAARVEYVGQLKFQVACKSTLVL